MCIENRGGDKEDYGLNRICARACLKNDFRQMYVTIYARFVPNEGGVAGWAD